MSFFHFIYIAKQTTASLDASFYREAPKKAKTTKKSFSL